MTTLLDKLQIGVDAIVRTTKRQFRVAKRMQDGDQIYIYGDNGVKYRLEDIDHDWYKSNERLENWKEEDLRSLAGMLCFCVTEDDEVSFNLLRGSYSREVLKASSEYFDPSSKIIIKDWVQNANKSK